MKYEEWEPIYQEICEYFSFDPAEDERASEILSSLTTSDASSLLSDLIHGKGVTVCGNAPTLSRELDTIRGVIIAADAAAGVLIQHDIFPSVIVTDLDGIDEYAIELNRKLEKIRKGCTDDKGMNLYISTLKSLRETLNLIKEYDWQLMYSEYI